MILRHMIDIDETVKLTQGQGHKVKGHFLQKSTFGSMKMCICIKQARLTYLRGVDVLVIQVLLLFCFSVLFHSLAPSLLTKIPAMVAFISAYYTSILLFYFVVR